MRDTELRLLSIRFLMASASLTGLLSLGLPGLAYTHLEISGVKVTWPGSQISYGIGWSEDDDWDAAVRKSFTAWSQSSSSLTLSEDTGLRGQTDTTNNNTHLVVLDSSNSSGWFTDSSFVAVTPVWTDGSGTILDADVILNGKDHQFDTSGSQGTFDLESILAHEIGHFIGLDHTGVFDATLYPFVAQQDFTPRTLSGDDVAGARSGMPQGEIQVNGFVQRSNASPIKGAHVVLVDSSGAALATCLTDQNGSYQLVGIEPGQAFRVFAEPLDGPVSQANLSTQVETDFQTTELSAGSFALSLGQIVNLPTIVCADKTFTITGLVSSPFFAGASSVVTVSGSGFSGAETYSFLGESGLSLVSVSGSGSLRTLTIQASASAAPGIRTLLINSSGRMALVAGCLEVLGSTPALAALTPSQGPAGTFVSLAGSGFRPGAVVSVGGQLATGVTVVNANQIILTVPQGSGSAAVVVQNPDGQWSTEAQAFSFNGSSGGSGSSGGGGAGEPGQEPGESSGGQASSGSGVVAAAASGGGGGGGCSLRPDRGSQEGSPLAALLLLILALLGIRRITR